MPGKKVLPRCSATKLKMQTLQGFCGEGWSLSSTSPHLAGRNAIALPYARIGRLAGSRRNSLRRREGR